MSANVRIEINDVGVRELLNSAGVLDDLHERADRIAAAAGPGHEVIAETGPVRARAVVITASNDAIVAEGTDRTLTRAIDAGR